MRSTKRQSAVQRTHCLLAGLNVSYCAFTGSRLYSVASVLPSRRRGMIVINLPRCFRVLSYFMFVWGEFLNQSVLKPEAMLFIAALTSCDI